MTEPTRYPNRRNTPSRGTGPRTYEKNLLHILAQMGIGLLILVFSTVTLSHLIEHSASRQVPLVLHAEASRPSPGKTVTPDTRAPELSGIHDLVVYAGDTVAYREGILAVDDLDPAPVISVDAGQVDLTTPGTYTVIYTATDRSGNSSSRTASLEVRMRQADFVEAEAVTGMADELIDQMGIRGLAKEGQIHAIYNWLHEACQYVNQPDRGDYLQAAYRMMVNRQGDCYNYAALSKLLFNRLGIDNLDVEKLRRTDADSEHYWNMVSADGGRTWYHFDSTPRMGQTESFCMVTDAFLDTYSETHGHCHRRDPSLYPATPEA